MAEDFSRGGTQMNASNNDTATAVCVSGGARVRVGACVRAHACASVRRFVRARA